MIRVAKRTSSHPSEGVPAARRWEGDVTLERNSKLKRWVIVAVIAAVVALVARYLWQKRSDMRT